VKPDRATNPDGLRGSDEPSLATTTTGLNQSAHAQRATDPTGPTNLFSKRPDDPRVLTARIPGCLTRILGRAETQPRDSVNKRPLINSIATRDVLTQLLERRASSKRIALIGEERLDICSGCATENPPGLSDESQAAAESFHTDQ